MTLSAPKWERTEIFGFGGEGRERRWLRYRHLTTCSVCLPCSYYLKESKGSRRWLLFLEGRFQGLRWGGGGAGGVFWTVDQSLMPLSAGGWYCFNRENCDSRYTTMRRLMSSKDWPHTRTGQQHKTDSVWWK